MDDNLSGWAGLLPKEETTALQFISQHPSWDGRGITVAILDTGVDPGALGLQSTSDGKPKVINCIDCSGSGDVSMGPPQTPSSTDPHSLTTSDGRLLRLNPQWINPSNQYRVGRKRAYELYPRGLKERVKEERKKNVTIATLAAEARLKEELNLLMISSPADSTKIEDLKARMAQLSKMDKEEDPGPIYDCLVWHDGTCWQAVVDTTETGDMSKSQPMTNYHVHLQFSRFSQIDALNYCVNIYDEGNVLSIVVDAGAHGSHVAGIVGAFDPGAEELNGVAPGAQIVSLKIGDSRLGSMETGAGLMRGLIEAVRCKCDIINMSYGEATSWDDQGSFIKLANEVVNKHGIIFVSSAGNNGPALSTVGCPGGTSTCCIGVGAYLTQSLMGVAYSMTQPSVATNYTWSSCGPALDGALGVSVMAPGGAVTSVPNWTLKRNQLMNGTSMSSPNAAGCIALLLSAAKQTGMKVTPIRMRRAIENSALYIPSIDKLGQGHGLIQVVGAWEILSSSASTLSSPSTSSNDNTEDWGDISYSVSIDSERFERGIYLRQAFDTRVANTFKVTVEPVFHEDTTPETKINFEVRMKLTSTVPWVLCPEKVEMVQGGKTFNVVVDPCALAENAVHTGTIKIVNENKLSQGSILEIPITVVKPEIIPDCCTVKKFGTINLAPAERYRSFVVPPRGCSFIDCVITDCRQPITVASNSGEQEGELNEQSEQQVDASSRMIVVHALQTMRGTPYRKHEKHSYLNLMPGSAHTLSWSVLEGVTMEFVVARNWNTTCDGTVPCNVTLYFRGVTPIPSEITIHGGAKVSNVIRVFSHLSPAELSPSASLNKWIAVVKPSAAGKISPLGERDILPNGTINYQMILEYDFEQTENLETVPTFPGLQGILYESDFHGQFFMIYDSKKSLIGVGDAWPSAIKINKGKYTVRLQVRHEKVAVLESLVDMPMHLQRTLKSAISLTFYKTQSDTLVGADKMKGRAVSIGGQVSMYIKEMNADQLPKAVSCGDILLGSVTYLRKNAAVVGNGTKPDGYVIRYIVSDTKMSASSSSPAKAADTGAGPSTNDAPQEDGIPTILKLKNDAIKEATIKFLKSQIGAINFDTLYTNVIQDFPDNLEVRKILLAHTNKLKIDTSTAVTNADEFAKSEKAYKAVTDAADSVISLIDQNAVAMEFGRNVDKDDVGALNVRKEMEGKKASLIEAFSAKAAALYDLIKLNRKANEKNRDDFSGPFEEELVTSITASTSTATPTVDPVLLDATTLPVTNPTDNKSHSNYEQEFITTCKQLASWDDLSADKHWQLQTNKFKLNGHYGLALKRVNDLISSNADNKTKESVSRGQLYEERLDIMKSMGWTHLIPYSEAFLSLAKKKEYDCF